MANAAIGWCFTLNNYTEEEENHIRELDVRYLVYGQEIGENGTPHLQGYLELKVKKRFNQVKQMVGDRAHIEMRKGTPQSASDYCVKGGVGIFTKGKMGGNQGHRTDLDKVRTLALESGMRAVSATANYQQIKTAEIFLTYNEEPRDFKPKVIWIHGPSGSGKTRKAHEICGTEDTYVKIGTNKWWDGYDAHENVIIDDFRSSTIPFVDLLGLLDRYEYRVEIKGKMRQFLAKTIVITTLESPQEMYKYMMNEPVEQLLRRIDEIINLNLNNISPSIPVEDGTQTRDEEEEWWG